MQTQLVVTPVAHKLVSEPYQERNDIIALFLQPNQNTGCVQSTAVRQNHCTFRHDEGFSIQQVEKLWSGSWEETAGNQVYQS